MITGLILSTTSTVLFAAEAFPFTSVTVKVTTLVPTLVQSKLLLDKLIAAIPQLSKDPLSIAATVVDANPELFK